MRRLAPFLVIGVVALLTLLGLEILLHANARALAKSATSAPASGGGGEADLGHMRGPKDFQVTLEEFGDFQCPSCAETAVSIRKIEQEYHDQLRLVFYEFPLEMHLHARAAARAAEAAEKQGHFWEMHDLLYQHQTSWAYSSDVRADFEDFALQLQMNMTRFRQDLLDPATAAKVEKQRAYGVARGVKNTPTLFVNGKECPPPFSPEHLREAIVAALARESRS